MHLIISAVRGVSDYADENKDDNWRDRALKNAASFLLSFVRSNELSIKEAPKTEKQPVLIAIHHLSLYERASIQKSLEKQITYKGFDVKEIHVNQIKHYRDGQLVNPAIAFDQQKQLLQRLDDLVALFPRADVGYFGLAHIPFMFDAGFQIGRRVVEVFRTDRQSGEWLELSDKGVEFPLKLLNSPVESSDDSKDIVIRVSVSYLVRSNQIADVIGESATEYHLGLDQPQPDVVVTNEQVDRYARLFHSVLVDISNRFPKTERIHLFISAPPTVVFRFGQQVNRTIDPPIHIYNYSKADIPNYGWSLNIMTGEILDLRDGLGVKNDRFS